MNLRETFEGYFEEYKSPVFVMNQIHFVRLFPGSWPPPNDGEYYFDYESKAVILIDNKLSPEQLSIREEEPRTARGEEP